MFVGWCSERKINPLATSTVAEFMIYLKTGRNLAPSTIEGYKAAICGTLALATGTDISKDTCLTKMIQNFWHESPRTQHDIPAWDLGLVLRYFRTSRFLDLWNIDMKDLTLKTVFITAIASGRRRSEIHALSFSTAQFSDNSVTLRFLPSFRPKTVKPHEIPSPILLPALDVDPALCPVRILSAYAQRTANVAVRKGRKRFFIPFSKTAPREVAAGTISSWIKQAITMAYEAAKEECRKRKAHDTRSMTASWALSKSVPLADIMSTAGWSSESTPRQHYLHEIEDRTDAQHFVAVQTVL